MRPRRRRTTSASPDADADNTDPKTNNKKTNVASAAASTAEAAQRRHRAALERRLGSAGLGLPAATVQRVAQRSAAPRGGVPADPAVVAARAVALRRLLGPALAARVLYTHPTILARDESALARNLSAWRATLTELDERAEAARRADAGDGDGGVGGDDDDEQGAQAASSSSSSSADATDASAPAPPESQQAVLMMRRLTKVPALLALRPERAVPHLFETAVLLGVPPRQWDGWAAGRAPHLASLRPDTVAAKLAAAHAALNWRADPLAVAEAGASPPSSRQRQRQQQRLPPPPPPLPYDDNDDESAFELVSMDEVRAAARRDYRWLLYASSEVRRRLEALARVLEEEAGEAEAEDEAEPGGATVGDEARAAATAMFLRQPSLVCKPTGLIVRRLRAFAALPGIDGGGGGGATAEEGEEEDQEDDNDHYLASSSSSLLPRSLRALASMPSLLNLQPEALQARWARLRGLAARCPRWRHELRRMAPSTLAGVLALSERRVSARAALLAPLLEALEAGGGVDAEKEEEMQAEAGPDAGESGQRRRRRRPPPRAKAASLRSLAYELKCTERAFAARRNGGGGDSTTTKKKA